MYTAKAHCKNGDSQTTGVHHTWQGILDDFRWLVNRRRIILVASLTCMQQGDVSFAGQMLDTAYVCMASVMRP